MTDLILKYGLILVSFFLISCLDKSNNSNQLSAFGDVKSFEKLQKTKLLAGQDKSLNHLMDYLKFSGTVELEVMKLIDSNYKKTTKIPSQINILYQLLDPEKHSQIFYDCRKIKIITQGERSDIFKNCEQRSEKIAEIYQKNSNLISIRFIQAQWKSVIGDSALLNLKDKVCEILISENKVDKLNCKDTLLTLKSDHLLEEIKIEKYEFDRQGKKQIVVNGGRFKNMLQTTDIQITVPDGGRIERIEKELKSKDEYLKK